MTMFSVFITQISHSRVMDGETWIASDGRAYLVHLRGCSELADPNLIGAEVSRAVWQNESLLIGDQNVDSNSESSNVPLRWHGTCIHDFQTPKWVQKQRRVDSETSGIEDIYQEPRRATCVAINIKFSLFAFGTHRQDTPSLLYQISHCALVGGYNSLTFHQQKELFPSLIRLMCPTHSIDKQEK